MPFSPSKSPTRGDFLVLSPRGKGAKQAVIIDFAYTGAFPYPEFSLLKRNNYDATTAELRRNHGATTGGLWVKLGWFWGGVGG